jgi:hypothetical protein
MSRDWYYVGEQWEIDAAIVRTKTKAPTDLAGLKIRISKPDKTESIVTPSNTGVGADTIVIDFTMPGTWHATWENDAGELRGVESISARVLKAPLSP